VRGRICAGLKTNVKKMDSNFEWDNDKNVENKNKHHVSFDEAQYAFFDSNRVIFEDVNHSDVEQRFYCLGKNKEGSGILTVRFTYRHNRIRIIGAGYWRKGRKIYEKENNLQR
jgi:uncharacterized DUF497 family protein